MREFGSIGHQKNLPETIPRLRSCRLKLKLTLVDGPVQKVQDLVPDCDLPRYRIPGVLSRRLDPNRLTSKFLKGVTLSVGPMRLPRA